MCRLHEAYMFAEKDRNGVPTYYLKALKPTEFLMQMQLLLFINNIKLFVCFCQHGLNYTPYS